MCVCVWKFIADGYPADKWRIGPPGKAEMDVSAAPRVVLPVTVPIVDDPTDAVKKLFVVGSYDDGGTFSLVLGAFDDVLY